MLPGNHAAVGGTEVMPGFPAQEFYFSKDSTHGQAHSLKKMRCWYR